MKIDISKQFLIICFGVLFLSTGLYRIRLLYKYHHSDHRSPSYEITNTFRSPEYLKFAIIAAEITVGLLLLLFSSSERYLTILIWFVLVMLTVSVLLVITINWKKIVSTFDDVWTFHPTMVAVVLHITYLIVTISVLL